MTLKELFTAHRRAHVDSSIQEAWIAAFVQARSQKIYFPGEQFSFSFRVQSKVKDCKRKVQTPAVHNFELALEHRKQVLNVLEKSSRSVAELRVRQKNSSNTKKVSFQAHMSGMQKQLLGYISCELHNRKGVITLRSKRFRLLHKQSLTSRIEGTNVLPWLTGLVVDQTKKNVEVQEGLRAFLDSDGVSSLQNFLRGALHKHLSGPHLALEEVKPRAPAGTSRKRKSTSMVSAPHAKVAKDHSAGASKTTVEEQSSPEGWQPRLRPRV